MSLLIKNWSLADWKELLMWARIGANNAMIGEFAEVEEVPPHGDLVDRAEMREIAISLLDEAVTDQEANAIREMWSRLGQMPVYIPAEDNTDFFTAGHLHLGYAEEGET